MMSGNSFIQLAAIAVCLAFGGSVIPATADEQPKSSGQELFDQLKKDADAETLADRIRETRKSMEALMSADRDTLFSALNAVIADGGVYQQPRFMLVEQCARKDPDAAVAKLEAILNPDLYQGVGYAVWGIIARRDPDRAAAAVQKLYQPGESFNRSTLQSGNFYGLVGPIMNDVGAAWFRRDGLKAMNKLNALPHAEDLDGYLFQGMCEAAGTADQILALLGWMSSPPGKRISRAQKGRDNWYVTMLMKAAREDLGKTRMWVERWFPAGEGRKSNESSDWDITRFRQALFHTWAETEPRPAAEWLMAQLPVVDRDATSTFTLCYDTLSSSPHAGREVALDWLVQQKDRPAFVMMANRVLKAAAVSKPPDKELKRVTEHFSKLPLALRERILMHPNEDLIDTRPISSLSTYKQVLLEMFPLEEERKRIDEKMREKFPAKPDAAQDDELDERQPGAKSPPDALVLAKRLAAQFTDLQNWRSSPQARLAGVASLEWLARAKTAEFTSILQAHLENAQGEIDGFAIELVHDFADHDWRACEKFAWEIGRESILIGTFQRAAIIAPDEVFARLKTLIADGRLHEEALSDEEIPQVSGFWWFAFEIPNQLGAGWIANDGTKGVAKMMKLPAGWIGHAINGAAGKFRSAEEGLALLDWIVRMDAEDPKGEEDEDRCTGFSLSRWWQAGRVFSRLAAIDLDAAIRWLEASPERLKRSEHTFDGYHDVYQVFLERDPMAAAEWARRVRPDEDVTWDLVTSLAKKDEAKALAWIDAHPDDPHLDSGLSVIVKRWEIAKPAEAAKLVARMSKARRADAAADLIHTWKRLDPVAAQRFLDETFAESPKERKAVEAQIDRLEKYARDGR